MHSFKTTTHRAQYWEYMKFECVPWFCFFSCNFYSWLDARNMDSYVVHHLVDFYILFLQYMKIQFRTCKYKCRSTITAHFVTVRYSLNWPTPETYKSHFLLLDQLDISVVTTIFKIKLVIIISNQLFI